MYCTKCGASIPDDAIACPKCGCATKNYYSGEPPYQQSAPEHKPSQTEIDQKVRCIVGGLLAILGFVLLVMLFDVFTVKLLVFCAVAIFGGAYTLTSSILEMRSENDEPEESPFYKRWWFVVAVFLLFSFGVSQAITQAVPSNTSASQPSPAPATVGDEPYTPPAPITYSGYGDDYFDITPFDDLYYFKISGNSEARHFSVTGYDAAGNYTELFVNTTDQYSGYVLDPDQDTRTLEINSEGNWTVRILPLATAPVITPEETYCGNGDGVFIIPAGATTAKIHGNSEEHHFAVETYGERHDLLVNTTSLYDGKVRVDPGALILTVNADGGWTILFD